MIRGANGWQPTPVNILKAWRWRRLLTLTSLPPFLSPSCSVDAIDYKVPALVRLAAVATFAASGVAIAASSSALLGDEIWAVSTGLGTCMAAGMFEVGRPKRMSVEEAQEKEAQWQEFGEQCASQHACVVCWLARAKIMLNRKAFRLVSGLNLHPRPVLNLSSTLLCCCPIHPGKRS
jgi:hypothetical protein